MPPRFLDTNILMRYFTRDDKHKAEAALALLRRIQAGPEQVTTSLLVLFEVVFLECTYQLPKERVADAVLSVLTLPGVKLANKILWRVAFQVHLTYSIDFADAYAACMQRTGVSEIYTWDEDFDQFLG